MASFISLCCSYFSYFCSNFQLWCWGDMSHTSSAPVVHQPTVCLATFPHPPLLESSTANAGDLVMAAPSPPWPVVALVESPRLVEPMSEAREESAPMMPGADGALQGAANDEVDGAGP
jgi:hypothetical protein